MPSSKKSATLKKYELAYETDSKTEMLSKLKQLETDYLTRPKKFDIGFMKKFMIIFGPLSSLFDAFTFLIMWYVFHFAAAG